MPVLILISLIILACATWYALRKIKNKHRKKIYSQPFPQLWIDILKKNIPIYNRVPLELLPHLHGCILLFLHEKDFVGRGITLDEEIRLTISGNACLLLLHRRQTRFPGFKTVIIYPDTYVAKQTNHHDSLESIENSHRAGESWVRGPIVLSWGDSIRGSLNDKDGHNVILHEIAHKLDEQSGDMNGLPVLSDNKHYATWAKVLNEEFNALKHRAKRGKNSVLDEYGTLSAPEFFAVATESFYEKPQQMKKKLPDLYQELSVFYNIDPASW